MAQRNELTHPSRLTLAASFLPAPLRRRYAADPTKISGPATHGTHAALLWTDIVGFTPLSNRLVERGPNGVEKLSQLLRSHYGPLLETIIAHCGEPIMVSGDGLLAIWPCDADSLGAALLRAVACGEAVLSLDAVIDDWGHPITNHVVVACGACRTVEIGGFDGRWLFLPIGAALDDLKAATSQVTPGHILLSPAAVAVGGANVSVVPLDHGCARLEAVNTRPARKALQLAVPGVAAFEAIQAYVPSPVAVRLNIEHLEWLAELRRVTVVFLRLLDLDHAADEALEKLHKSLSAIQPIVHRHDGVINQVCVHDKGVTIVIYFGAPPVAHSDDPARGVRTALDLQRMLLEMGQRASLGVASGRAFSGVLGNDILRHYTLIGDVVNLVSRLMAATEDAILCDEQTMLTSQSEVAFESMPPVKLKGYEGPVKVWAPLRSDKSRTEVTLRTPMVGREEELQLLLQNLRKVAHGERASLILEAEAGVGKTRLLAAFRAEAEESGMRVLISAADRVERNVPYHAWRAIYSALFQIEAESSPELRRETVARQLGAELTDRACLLNAVLPLGFVESEAIAALSGQQRAAAAREMLVEILRRTTAQAPLGVVIEDAHWLDDASWDLAYDIAASNEHVFLAISMRPLDDEARLRPLLKIGTQRLLLGDLSNTSQDRLISAKLGVANLPKEVSSIIRRLARGNPFFCSELTQWMVEGGVIEVVNGECRVRPDVDLLSLALPPTVQSAITLRIDRLSPTAQLALKVSSVAGERFPLVLIRDIYPIETDRPRIPGYLKLHARRGMLESESVHGRQGYAFNHAITRDVVYNLMLFEHRRQLHRQVALWYEKKFADDLSPYFALLADHWEQAEEPTHAVDYLEREAMRAFSLGLAKQAVEVSRHGARLVGVDLPMEPSAVGAQIGQQMNEIGQRMAGRVPVDLLKLPRLQNPTVERLLWLLLQIGPFAFQSGQIELFALIAVTGLRVTLEHGIGPPSAAVASLYSIVHASMMGDRVGASDWSQLALDLDEHHGRLTRSRVAFVHGWFHNHWFNPLESSLDLTLDGARAGFESGDIMFACFNLSAFVIYLAALGRPLDEVMETARAHLRRNGKRVMNSAFHLVLELQVAKALAGRTTSPFNLTDAEYDEELDLASICKTELENQIGYYFVARLKLHTHFGDWEGALEWAKRACSLRPAFAGQIAEIDLVQFLTLAALGRARELSGSPARSLIEEARVGVETMRGWANWCATNFAHKALLLEGMLEGLTGSADVANKLLRDAASQAIASGYLHDAALARECESRTRRRQSDVVGAQAALRGALSAYGAWGAAGKVAYLASEFGIE